VTPSAARALLVAAAAAAALTAPASAAPLGPKELAGRRLYLEGRGAGGREVTAFLGGTALPASAVACAGCHGADGGGRPEGGILPPPVGWSELARPGGHVHPAGRRHPPFDARSLVRAVTEGIDPAGNALDPAMPRFSLSREEGEDLVAYLRVVERERDPGVADRTLRVATVLPTRGRAAPVGDVMRRVLEASLSELNASGGVHGRRVVLSVAGYDSDAGGAVAALAALLAREPSFALLSGFTPGAEEALAALAEQERLPLVAPFALATPAPADTGRYAFYAFAGLREQARALARFAARDGGERPRAAVLHPAERAAAEAAEAAAAELRAAGFPAVERRSFEPGALGRAAPLPGESAGLVLFLGGDADLADFLRRAADDGSTPRVLALAPLAGRAATLAPAAFQGRVFLAYPAAPGGEGPAGAEALRRLRARAGVSGQAAAAQLSAATAAAILVEGLRRAGRRLTREGLVEALEGFHDLDVALAPPLTFSAARRVGAPGAYVVAVDQARHALVPVGGFVAVE
jgi:ABC-type branched-subunit amino acid transport system substrate-binding protein